MLDKKNIIFIFRLLFRFHQKESISIFILLILGVVVDYSLLNSFADLVGHFSKIFITKNYDLDSDLFALKSFIYFSILSILSISIGLFYLRKLTGLSKEVNEQIHSRIFDVLSLEEYEKVENNFSDEFANSILFLESFDFTSIIQQLLLLLQSNLFILLFFAFSFKTSPISTAFLLLFLFAVLLLSLLKFRGNLSRVSRDTATQRDALRKELTDIRSLLIEMRILNINHFLKKRFNASGNILRNAIREAQFIVPLPKYLIDFILTMLIIIISTIILIGSIPASSITGSIAILFALQKSLPHYITILRSTALINSRNASLTKIREFLINSNHLKNLESHNKNSIYVDNIRRKSIPPSISIENIYFSYPKANNYLLEGLSFNIDSGKLNVISGPSGSGKSTLLEIILGIRKPIRGEIKPIFDDDLEGFSRSSNLASYSSYVPQKPNLIHGSIAENIVLGRETDCNDRKLRETLELSGLSEFSSNLYDTQLLENGMTLSGGQIARLALARALFIRPKILFIDELTSGLDYKVKKIILSKLYNIKSSCTIVFSTHDEFVLKQADKIIDIKQSSIK